MTFVGVQEKLEVETLHSWLRSNVTPLSYFRQCQQSAGLTFDLNCLCTEAKVVMAVTNKGNPIPLLRFEAPSVFLGHFVPEMPSPGYCLPFNLLNGH